MVKSNCTNHILLYRRNCMEIITFLKIILPLICSGAFMLLPRTFKNDRIFSIQLPDGEGENIHIKNTVRLYKLLTCIFAVILACTNLYCILKLENIIADLCLTIILFIIIIVQASLYALGSHLTRRCVKKYLPASERTLSATEPIDIRTTEGDYCPPMWVYIVHAAFILLCIYIICSSFCEISPYLPLWCNFAGDGMFYVQKSYPVLFLPVILQLIFTLLGIKISYQIKNAPLDKKTITSKSLLDKSRKKRAMRFIYVYLVTALLCIASCVYIFCMFIMPAHRLFAIYFVYALFLALILSLAWVAKRE